MLIYVIHNFKQATFKGSGTISEYKYIFLMTLILSPELYEHNKCVISEFCGIKLHYQFEGNKIRQHNKVYVIVI